MPIHEPDPWRVQYFTHAVCPDDVDIPTDDPDSWRWYPQHRWVYDKIAVALSQGLDAAPHGVVPPRFPVFSKPITNLKGMGAGSRVIASAADYAKAATPGHMWMTMLEGAHVSSDIVLIDGMPRWWRHVTGEPGDQGTFDTWTVHAGDNPALEAYCGAWTRQHLRGYTGVINVESIGGRMIEVHLRMSDQWPDLYGAGWVDAVVRLYSEHRWDFEDRDRSEGYSVVLFAPHGPAYRHPPADLVARVAGMPGISSVQITFDEDKPPEQHAMPPGGFRVAIVNCWELTAGRAGRELLRQHFLAQGR
jgi:hypothetical protein